jgi:hypothetical protein
VKSVLSVLKSEIFFSEVVQEQGNVGGFPNALARGGFRKDRARRQQQEKREKGTG